MSKSSEPTISCKQYTYRIILEQGKSKKSITVTFHPSFTHLILTISCEVQQCQGADIVTSYLGTRPNHTAYWWQKGPLVLVIIQFLAILLLSVEIHMDYIIKYLFVCLGLQVPLSSFSLIWSGEGFQILTFTRHSWPLSSEGSLACRTYCDTGHLFIWSSPRTCDTHTCCGVFGSGAVTTFFYIRLRSVTAGIRTPNLPLEGWKLSPTAPVPWQMIE